MKRKPHQKDFRVVEKAFYGADGLHKSSRYFIEQRKIFSWSKVTVADGVDDRGSVIWRTVWYHNAGDASEHIAKIVESGHWPNTFETHVVA